MATVWWVNQGQTFDLERAGGYVWAPTQNSAGIPMAHHVNVSRLVAGDAVVHYATGAIRAIGLVQENLGTQPRPYDVPDEPSDTAGYLTRVEYHDLAAPIPLKDIPDRTGVGGPFTSAGSVNQGYLYPLSPVFAAKLFDAFKDRWPLAWLPRPNEPTAWLFQANPDQWDLESELPQIGVGGDTTWSATRSGADMRQGDPVVLWKSGPRAGIYGLAEVIGPVTTRPRPDWRPKSADSSAVEPVIPIRVTRRLTSPVLRSDLLTDSVLSNMAVIRAPQGTNFRLTRDEWRALRGPLNMQWDEFIYWAKRIKEWPGLDASERDYKLALAERISAARTEYLASNGAWTTALVSALRSRDNNITPWRAHNRFIEWITADSSAARTPMEHVWGASTEANLDITAFAAALPEAVREAGRSTLVTMASVLGMGVDALRYPPYRAMTFRRAYDLVEYGRPTNKHDLNLVWQHALAFLDRFIQEAADRGLQLRDRLDAQAIVWRIGQKAPLEHWSDEERRRFLLFVNQAEAGDDIDDGIGLPEPHGSLESLAAELCLDVDYLRRIEQLLQQKKQVIFYGPPGTGKTYVAKRLAEHFAGALGRIEKVQFHPSYAYEDFVEGFRPRLKGAQAGFKLVSGPLRRIAKHAGENSATTCVLLIDELNRGNVAKVFGELYYLLEYRDEELSLLYSAKPMSLPDNLWIIGTMNTADRSIALIDGALRRRFYFVPFYPDQRPVAGLLKRWLEREKPQLAWIADVVDEANKRLANSHVSIGPSYFMRKDLTDDWVVLIWEHAILPYLSEHFYGDEGRLADFALAALRSAIKPAV